MLEYREQQARNLEEQKETKAREAKLAAEAARQVAICGPALQKWNHAAVLDDLQLVPRFNAERDGISHPQSIRGTLLWTPPAVASTGEMFSLLKDKGWRPLWMRGNCTSPVRIQVHGMVLLTRGRSKGRDVVSRRSADSDQLFP
jgi:hypothetical protein